MCSLFSVLCSLCSPNLLHLVLQSEIAGFHNLWSSAFDSQPLSRTYSDRLGRANDGLKHSFNQIRYFLDKQKMDAIKEEQLPGLDISLLEVVKGGWEHLSSTAYISDFYSYL